MTQKEPANSQDEWRGISGFEEFYQASKSGFIRSLDRKVDCRINGIKRRTIPGRILKPSSTLGKGKGYYFVGLKRAGYKPKYITVHKAVALTFVPNPEAKPCVNHINGNKHDNRSENLEWCSYLENTTHALETGLTPRGEGRESAKLTDDCVAEARRRYKSGDNLMKMADEYRVCHQTLHRAILGGSWKSANLLESPAVKRLTPITDALMEEIVLMFESMSVTKISKKLNLSYWRVDSVIRKSRIKRNKKAP